MRFVILTHDHPVLHWDLMLEDGEALTTFRLLEEPVAGTVIAAEPIAPHRKAYLDYEGPVSGGRGSVTRWDHGTFRELQQSPGARTLLLTGQRGRFKFTLQSHAGNWSCTVEPA
jgi:hypothetical protein